MSDYMLLKMLSNGVISANTAREIFYADNVPIYATESIDISDLPSNCPNCGAPVVAATCEYCGSRILARTSDGIIFAQNRIDRYKRERAMEDSFSKVLDSMKNN